MQPGADLGYPPSPFESCPPPYLDIYFHCKIFIVPLSEIQPIKSVFKKKFSWRCSENIRIEYNSLFSLSQIIYKNENSSNDYDMFKKTMMKI